MKVGYDACLDIMGAVMEWGAYWPEWEFWLLWQSWVTCAVAMGTIMIGFVTNRWSRAIGIAVLGFLTLYAIALTEKIQTKSERDYAYFFIPDNQPILPDGKIMLHRRATGPLSSVDFAFAQGTKGILGKYVYSGQAVRFPEGTGYAFPVEAEDWSIDIDPLPITGQVKQRLNISVEGGKATTVFAQVSRKHGKREILCETPKRNGIPLCE